MVVWQILDSLVGICRVGRDPLNVLSRLYEILRCRRLLLAVVQRWDVRIAEPPSYELVVSVSGGAWRQVMHALIKIVNVHGVRKRLLSLRQEVSEQIRAAGGVL